MKPIVTSAAPAAIGPYSQAIEVNGFVYASGQLPIDPATGAFPEGGVQEQTRQSLLNVKAILEEAGLTESGVSRLIRSAYTLLNLETYFTTGPDETRAWTYTKGMKAPQAAGIIHTDFEKGFIRAEVIKYADYTALGSEKACREAGKISVEGKEYVVQDGDIMHFLFNV